MTHAAAVKWVAAVGLAIVFVGAVVALHPLFKRYRTS
jgi:hypothetical protein